MMQELPSVQAAALDNAVASSENLRLEAEQLAQVGQTSYPGARCGTLSAHIQERKLLQEQQLQLAQRVRSLKAEHNDNMRTVKVRHQDQWSSQSDAVRAHRWIC